MTGRWMVKYRQKGFSMTEYTSLEKIRLEPRPPNVTVITGPSKTADIEGALVTGVHGPGLVQVFLVREVDSG